MIMVILDTDQLRENAEGVVEWEKKVLVVPMFLL